MPTYSELPLISGQFSRRDFSRLLALGAAGIAMPRGSSEGQLAWTALRGLIPPNAIRINSNENPLGPSAAALNAMQALGAEDGRYPFAPEKALEKHIAELEGLPPGFVELYNGSSDPLHRCVLTFTDTSKPYVYGEPGFEAGWQAARITGAQAIPVPLTSTIAHDVKGMVAASSSAGLLYICNPNNPTGTTTPREDIIWALANKPSGSMLLVDEAYIHFSDERSVAELTVTHPDLIVLRTFSKLYGMAGLRMGMAIGQPATLEKLHAFGPLISSTTGLAAAKASVDDPQLISTRRAYTRQAREETFAFLTKYNYRFHPSVSNCFMLDAGRPAAELAAAMAQRGVLIGRTWPSWPTYARITVGTPEEMRVFCTELKSVTA